jgi:hypothetical protein
VTLAPASFGNLVQIIYCSRSLLGGTTAEIAAGLADILAVSHRENPRQNITGALFYNGRAFAQALEGSPLAISNLYEHILRDKRHTDVCLLRYEYVANRCFEGWAMAFVQGIGGQGFTISPVLLQDVIETSEESAGAVLQLMRYVMQER